MRIKKNALRSFLWQIVVLILLSGFAGPGAAQIKYFDLTNPYLRKIPMAIPVFRAMTASAQEREQIGPFADSLQEMLDFSGYFKMLDRGSFLYDPQTSGITEKDLNFANWTAVGAEMLITGGLQIEGNNLVVELRLFDTFKAKLLVEFWSMM